MARTQQWLWTYLIDDSAVLDWLHNGLVGTKGVSSIYRSSPNTLDLSTSRIPVWAIVLAIILFPSAWSVSWPGKTRLSRSVPRLLATAGRASTWPVP
jgi:hypothetical protein